MLSKLSIPLHTIRSLLLEGVWEDSGASWLLLLLLWVLSVPIAMPEPRLLLLVLRLDLKLIRSTLKIGCSEFDVTRRRRGALELSLEHRLLLITSTFWLPTL